MKNLYSIIFALLLSIQIVSAQAPGLISYQAVVRNSSNELVVNSPISVKISLLQNSASGTEVYSELHQTTSNENGLITIEIGGGTSPAGDFSQINWANGPYFLKTEIDPTGQSNYSITGISQLLSVPYALYAKTSGSSTPGPAGPQGPAGPAGATGPQGPQGPGNKVITGYVSSTSNVGSGYTLERLANKQYRVSWPAGTFGSYCFPTVYTYSGTIAMSHWGASSDGSGSFTTVTNAPDTFWFTVIEIK